MKEATLERFAKTASAYSCRALLNSWQAIANMPLNRSHSGFDHRQINAIA